MSDINHLGNCDRVTTINNEDVVLTDSEGKRFKINKVDLAEVIRQVMPVATYGIKGLTEHENLLIYRGDCSDCNNADHGIYRTLPNSTNVPESVMYSGTLISFICFYYSAYKFQLFFNASGESAKLYWRRKTDDSWKGWAAL